MRAVLACHLLATALSTPLLAQDDDAEQPPRIPDLDKMARVWPRSPAETIASIQLPPGYRLELVASEPMIHEPAVLAWDGNGRMYVAEMRTYMQDIDGTGAFEPRSRISRLEDTDGDGVADKHTVFVDGLVLPRMILTLQDGIVVRETNTLDLWEYRDTDDDGKADWKEKIYEGGKRGGNLEHQPSGLLWNLDNRLYVTYTNKRYRYRNGAITAEKLAAGDGQWGLTQDDFGRLFYSRAGGEVAASSFQQNLQYGKLDLDGQLADEFSDVWPIDDIPDVQGGEGRLRDDNTLNHFTAGCGQVVYRGDRLPAELRGDLFICEPVGRLIRRADVSERHGKVVLTNVYERSEFLRTEDANFRPINMYTAPDGTMYIVDMYRGIIQEGNWVREGSFLRDVVQDYGLDRNIGRGRIYRLVHNDFERGPKPRMLDESSAELVAHLSHRNGWWRDTAQKLLVLRGDRTVEPALCKLLRTGEPVPRLHALWTLDGLGALDRETILATLRDPDAHLRTAAVRLCESWLQEPEPDGSVLDAFRAAANDADPRVAAQVIRTAFYTEVHGHRELIDAILAAHADDEGMRGAAKAHLDRIAKEKAEAERLAKLRLAEAELADAIERGKKVYDTFCFACHGPDGVGAPVPGEANLRLAPSLVGSPRVLGAKARLGRILLHGLSGPVDGVTYPSAMVSMAVNDDAWIADVLSFVRNSFDNDAGIVKAEDIAAIRAECGERVKPWTLEELKPFDPILRARERWKLTASHRGGKLGKAIDGDEDSRWSTGTTQKPGMWLQIEFPFAVEVTAVELDTRGSKDDYPTAYEIRVSDDGEQWSDVVAAGDGAADKPLIAFEPRSTRFVKITQTGRRNDKYWSVHELQVYGETNPAPDPK